MTIAEACQACLDVGNTRFYAVRESSLVRCYSDPVYRFYPVPSATGWYVGRPMVWIDGQYRDSQLWKPIRLRAGDKVTVVPE